MVVKCDKCNFTALWNSLLKRHEIAVHSDLKPWKCSFIGCNYETKFKETLTSHARVHSTKVVVRTPFACTFDGCSYRSAQRSTLADHLMTKHCRSTRRRSFQCSMCASSFYCKASLTQHISSHVKERRFKCNHCEFSTHLRASLALHVNAKHMKSRTIFCKFPGCDFRTHWPAVYRRHARTHNKNVGVAKPAGKPCPFPSCRHEASSAGNLRKHIRSLHDPDRSRDFECPKCHLKFFNPVGVRAHIAGVHANQKVFACDKCPFSTSYTWNLGLHRRTVHEGVPPEKQFKCDLCDHRDSNRSKLQLH